MPRKKKITLAESIKEALVFMKEKGSEFAGQFGMK